MSCGAIEGCFAALLSTGLILVAVVPSGNFQPTRNTLTALMTATECDLGDHCAHHCQSSDQSDKLSADSQTQHRLC